MKQIKNADRPTISDIMSDPDYLVESLARRQVQEAEKRAAKQALGVKNPARRVETLDQASFAEGVVSSNDNNTPMIPVNTNPRFTR